MDKVSKYLLIACYIIAVLLILENKFSVSHAILLSAATVCRFVDYVIKK